jgi:D-glycero-alpha-D-manno-heptose-7-phosphate kinase
MIIESSAPTRVDIAGGTIDIPPLFLFHEGAATVNFAIDLLAQCRLETRTDEKIIIESVDRNLKIETSLGKINELAGEENLALPAKLVHFFKPQTGFSLITKSAAPAGAGLAGSSALNIAIIGALNQLVGNRYDESRFITIAANIETQVIKVPAGFQDYYPAQFGGAMCLHFKSDGIEREPLTIDKAGLENRIAICYTGEPRNSGINNWELTKRHIDGDRDLFNLFEGIRDTALETREAVVAGDWQRVGNILRAAQPERKKLSPNITTTQMDKIIETAMNAGAIAAKVCGAGGGGCIAFFCEEGNRTEIERALGHHEGAMVLNWRFAEQGLTVMVTES